MIKFVVGHNAKEMMIHTVLVAEQSLALNSLVNGLMKGAQEGVIWKDVDEQTFALFAEFVYTGEYTLLVVEDHATGSGIVPPHLIESTLSGLEPISKKKKNFKVKPTSFAPKPTKFQDLVYRSPTITTPPPTFTHSLRSPTGTTPDGYPNTNLLAHARLYVLAERYDIKKLESLALQKLHATLSQSNPSAAAYHRDVMVLIRYTYENTLSREHEDELRMLVSCYVADEGSKAIAQSKQCLDLIEEVGAFARDLVSALLARMETRSSLDSWG